MSSSRRIFWLPTLVAILILIALFIITSNSIRNAFLEAARYELASRASDKAQLLGHWRTKLTMSLLALAEQREIREGVAKIAAGQASDDWREGFVAAFNASARTLAAVHPALESLALYDRDAIKIGGSGADRELISYPDLNQRFYLEKLSPIEDKSIIPVRDPQANPLAYIVAYVDTRSSRPAVLPGKPPVDLLLCLTDSGGQRLWDSDPSLQIPLLDSSATLFELDGRTIFLLEHATVPGTSWTLNLARKRDQALSEFYRLRGSIMIHFGAGTILLILLSLIISRRLQ